MATATLHNFILMTEMTQEPNMRMYIGENEMPNNGNNPQFHDEIVNERDNSDAI